MKAQTTRIPPNYALIGIVTTSMIFWLAIIKIFFGHQIKEWILSFASAVL